MKIVVLSTRVLIYSALLGAMVLVAGVVLGFRIFPDAVQKRVWENSILKENTTQWDRFMKLPFPFAFKVFIFSVENVDDILQGATPVVKEIGPYVYTLYRWKSDIKWRADEVSYYEYSRYEFDQDASGALSEDDEVTVLNSPYNSLILTVEQMSPAVLETLNTVLSDIFKEYDGLFTSVKVKDFLFGGIAICANVSKDDFATKMICDQFKAKAKKTSTMRIENKTLYFSNFHHKNNSHFGRFTVNSGQAVREKVNDLVQYDSKSYTDRWKGENTLCDKIRGTTTFRPFVTSNMSFETFGEDICSYLEVFYSIIIAAALVNIRIMPSSSTTSSSADMLI